MYNIFKVHDVMETLSVDDHVTI